MENVPGSRLVIDASVARATGDVSMNLTSESCRKFLFSVKELEHRIVMSADITKEWDKHESNFARRWRLSMFVHKQLDLVTIAEPSPLRDQIHKSTTDANLVAIMEKDRPLIEAALATDKRVVSLDDKVRKQFRNHVHRLPEIRDVCWVNPSKADEKAVAWLESGAPADRDRLLGSPIAK